MTVVPELVNLAKESAQHGDKLAAKICREAIAEIEGLREALCEMLYAAEDFLASPDPRKPLPRPSMPLGQPTTVADCQRLSRAWENGERLVEYKEWLEKQTAEAKEG